MIDLKLLRDDLAAVRAAYERRGGVEDLEKVVELDAAGAAPQRGRDVRAEQKRASSR